MKPKSVVLKQDVDGGIYPFCPTCDEFAYLTDRCPFCGQTFKNHPNESERIRIELDGYTIVQTKNKHVSIRDESGRLVTHINCSKRLKTDELERMLRETLALIERKEERDG